MATKLTTDSISLDESYLLVAAIDFGTTYSGYAFSFKAKPNDIMINKNWGAEVGFESHKAPTCVMTKPDGSFQSFGYQAEYDYNELDPDEDEIGGPNGYNLYRNFKMLLHNKIVNLETTVVSTSGHARKAVDIFAMALKYLKNHMLEPIGKALESAPGPSEIRWILTVPAIWTDESKAFMREAAYRAGLIAEKSSRKLLFALEPEAASTYCRHMSVRLSTGQDDSDECLTFRSGETLLVIDAGGGTVDITCHEILLDGRVKEIKSPSGGPWGGITVDENFVALFTKIFGDDFVNSFKSREPQQWLKLMTDFERSKKAFVPGNKTTMKLHLPFSLGQAFVNIDQNTLGKMKELGISFRSGCITIKYESATNLFNTSVSNILKHVKSLISEGNTPKLDYALLVGGFGECKVLQEALRDVLTQHKIQLLVPSEAQLAIIKGAVMYGHNPMNITSRIARYTYGVQIREAFKEGIHDTSKKIIDRQGRAKCSHIFQPFIKKGEQVETGESSIYTFQPPDEYENIIFRIFKTDRENVTYIDEDGVKQIGEACLNNVSSTVEVKVTYGYTELLIEAREKAKGRDYKMKMTIDFIAD